MKLCPTYVQCNYTPTMPQLDYAPTPPQLCQSFAPNYALTMFRQITYLHCWGHSCTEHSCGIVGA